MGTDKARLEVDGRRLVDRAIDAVLEVAQDRIVVAGPDPGRLHTAVTCVADPTGPRQGPMAGVVTGWRQLARSFEIGPDQIGRVLVLSCDLPLIDGDVVARLVAASADGADAMAHDGERAQPLVAIYHRATVERLVVAFAAGERSLRRTVDPTQVVLVPIDGHRASDADSPEDLAAHVVRWPSSD